MTSRSVDRLYPAYRDDIGNLTTRRPVPGPGLEQVDPFLFLNHHGPQTYPASNSGLPFGPHPHRGFETVTFILTGSLAHHDSGGHESVIEAGGVQWMTAGSGLIHAEISPPSFKQTGGPLEILQLWVNLPGRLKMTTPAYTGLQADQLPAVPLSDGLGSLTLISGAFEEVAGPVRSLTDVFMSIVRLAARATVSLPAPSTRSVLLYVVSGTITAAGVTVEPWHLVTMHHDGDRIAIQASSEAVLLFGHAEPIGEPVVAHGPFVMNSREEISAAIRDYQAGRFTGTDPLIGVGI